MVPSSNVLGAPTNILPQVSQGQAYYATGLPIHHGHDSTITVSSSSENPVVSVALDGNSIASTNAMEYYYGSQSTQAPPMGSLPGQHGVLWQPQATATFQTPTAQYTPSFNPWYPTSTPVAFSNESLIVELQKTVQSQATQLEEMQGLLQKVNRAATHYRTLYSREQATSVTLGTDL
ncbi:hypothetical protein BKA70DRAFT_1428190 [Coprinopsis sp. MPI-PUGE-AT-0042]|nr:hypothetical protein BKA70DRAFT_1428190 [Coprinopsis sp. MPI-PUGE-AT-0042]